MSRNGKVIVAMSGGVDSSVAACLLKEQGYDCIGAFMRVGAAGRSDEASGPRSDEGANESCGIGAPTVGEESKIQNPKSKITLPQRRLKHGCCSSTDALDARLIAGKLGIPFYALNFEPDFGRIVDYFVDEYGRARTPNPCVMCNIHLKFGKLLRYAEMMDAEFVATGHYARTVELAADATADFGFGISTRELDHTPVSPDSETSRPAAEIGLARAANAAKDQSYVLFGIQRSDLPRCLFPLGGFADKAAVRRIAAQLELRVHDKPDSQEICFVPDNDYTKLLDARRPGERRPGEIHDAAGRVVGIHAGYQTYTIGQRRGLGIAIGRPAYVTGIDPAANTVTIGPREDLLASGLIADQMNWLVDGLGAAAESDGPWRACTIKIRHMHAPAAGRMRILSGGGVEARFDAPQPAVTPGQAAVFYSGELVVGGGWIRHGVL